MQVQRDTHERIHLCENLPTPLIELNISNIFNFAEPNQPVFYMKRDDLTGLELSGNKVRKLEFLLAEALNLGCDTVITQGGVQSNHCRATAAACARLGLECHLVLRLERHMNQDVSQLEVQGNLLLNKLFGAYMNIYTFDEYKAIDVMNKLQVKLETEQGKKVYCIPTGGLNVVGSQGYVEGIKELKDQMNVMKLNPFDYICVAVGSGGTVAGILAGLEQTDLLDKTKILAFVCSDSPEFWREHIATRLLPPLNLDRDLASNHVEFFQAKGEGYAKSFPAVSEVIRTFARRTGIVLDPVYTGKAMTALLGLLKERDFNNKRILFWNTGGCFSVFAYKEQLVDETSSP
jgi:D-cysteine desulfhydrase